VGVVALLGLCWGTVASARRRIRAAERDAARARANGERALRRAEMAEHAGRLARVAARLAEARTPDEVARVFLSQGLTLVGAVRGGLALHAAAERRLQVLPDEDGPRFRRWSELASALHPILARVARHGRPAMLPDRGSVAAAEPAMLARPPLLHVQALAVLPLVASGAVVGVLTAAFDRPQPFTQRERAVLRTLASLCGGALERARLSAVDHAIAEAVQRSLLPAHLPEPPRVSVVARSLPATSGARIGGDWYGCVELPDGRLAVMLGDVVGKGVRAAAVMGQLRHALHAYALQGLDPASAVGWADRLGLLGDDELATLLLGVLDVRSHTLRLANAGHLPPLVLALDGSAQMEDGAGGLPLGVAPGQPVPEQHVALEPGTTVVLYSDGLVEDRDRPLGDGLEQLQAAATAALGQHGDDLDGFCDTLLDAMVGGRPRGDDVTLLAFRLIGAEAPRQRASIVLPPEPRSVDRARRFTRATLASWGRSATGDDAELCVTELVGNALAVAVDDVLVDLSAGAEAVRLAVEDADPVLPVRLEPSVEPEHGRGIALVDALADRWGAEAIPTGKRVWCVLTPHN
jgi:hypothetical protein